MRFEWDPKKERANEKKHGISFELAALIFDDHKALTYEDRVVNTESRWHTVGVLEGTTTVFLVVHTIEEQQGDELIRIISARKATPTERKHYENEDR